MNALYIALLTSASHLRHHALDVDSQEHLRRRHRLRRRRVALRAGLRGAAAAGRLLGGEQGQAGGRAGGAQDAQAAYEDAAGVLIGLEGAAVWMMQRRRVQEVAAQSCGVLEIACCAYRTKQQRVWWMRLWLESNTFK